MNFRNLFVATSLFFMIGALRAEEIKSVASSPRESKDRSTRIPKKLPPLPKGVAELKFKDFFKPIGDRGLEYSDTLNGLDGRRVRILGYMVKSAQPIAGMFMLSPVPVTVDEEEYGLCDDLPVTIVHVFMPERRDRTVPFSPTPFLLTGTLSVGPREEADGRISTVRLTLDPPQRGGRRAKVAKKAKSKISTQATTANVAVSLTAESTNANKR